MVILLICMIPLAFIAGVFCSLKSVQLGLRWQIQTKNGNEPKLSSPPVTDTKKVDELGKYSKEQLQEWMFGKG